MFSDNNKDLKHSITLEIPFDPQKLPADVDMDQVFLSYFDETAQKWVFAGGQVDPNRNVIRLTTDHASWWTPSAWNWSAWRAIINKELSLSLVDIYEANELFYATCPQTGQYVQVDSSQANNMIQGCVDKDDPHTPTLRITNPTSIFIEVEPVSGGGNYPSPELLPPGGSISFEANTKDRSPLVVAGKITEKSSWYLTAHILISMLPGTNQINIKQLACITERAKDASYFLSAAEALRFGNGYTAIESMTKYILDADSMSRFIRWADDCNYGPAKTWSIKGAKQIAPSLGAIQSIVDYFYNYFRGNAYTQLAFNWATSQATIPTETSMPIIDIPIASGPPLDAQPGDTWTRPADGMLMIFIPAGEFLMGSSESDPNSSSDEYPQHSIYLDNYWIDQTEVTKAQYSLCVADGKCQPPADISMQSRSNYSAGPEFENYPVINVSWNDAQAYCSWAGGHLLTEAEWEKAARGTDGRMYPWGNEPPNCKLANYWGKVDGCVADTTKVGSYPAGASPYGVLDLAGNVWEWVQDWYDETYYSDAPASNPIGPLAGEVRIQRGGSLADEDSIIRSAQRYRYYIVIDPYGWIGIRCAH